MIQVVEQPIEVNGDKVTVRAEKMEADRPYRFVWGGVEVFAVKRMDAPGSTMTVAGTGMSTTWSSTNPTYRVEFFAIMPKD